MVWIMGCVPLWAIISRYSTNLFFDGVLYDIILFTGFTFGTYFIQGLHSSFSVANYVGYAMILAGLILLKVK